MAKTQDISPSPSPTLRGRGKARAKRESQFTQDKDSEQLLPPRFRFEPGSYGDRGRFMPSIACLKHTAPHKWEYHFVIVKPSEVYLEKDEAASRADKDLEAAFLQKQRTGSDYAVAEYLRAEGYLSVTGFRIVKESKERGDAWRP